MFPDLDMNKLPKLKPRRKSSSQSSSSNVLDNVSLPYMSQLEKCLLCKLFIRHALNEEFLGLIVDRHRTTIGGILKEWSPRWVS